MSTNDPTIVLYGIDGVYNYGCEAIVRGTEIILEDQLPEAKIKYASLRPEDDKKRLKGSNVEIIPRKPYPLWYPHKLNEISGYLTGIYTQKLFKENLSWLDDCDIVFSIGGDMYTLSPKYKEKSWNTCYDPLLIFGELVKKKGKKLVIWGASIGPFDDYPRAEKTYLDHLKKVDLITSREPLTTNYLKSKGLTNVVECPDPAFAIKMQNSQKIKKKDILHIGINLSPLSLRYSLKNFDTGNIIKMQAKVIENIIDTYNCKVSLIPHVVSESELDNDILYLKKIKSNISKKYQNNVYIITEDIGFLGIKNYLTSCDLVLAARMHLAINAISLGIPTIFISYSSKSIGLSYSIYGTDKWVITLKEFCTTKLLEKIANIFDEKPHISIPNNKEGYIDIQNILSSK